MIRFGTIEKNVSQDTHSNAVWEIVLLKKIIHVLEVPNPGEDEMN